MIPCAVPRDRIAPPRSANSYRPMNSPVDARLLLDRLRAGDAAGARSLAEAALADGPVRADLLCLLARACLALGDGAAADAALVRAELADPGFVPLWLERAALERAAARPAAQRTALERAWTLAPGHPAIGLDLARCRAETGDADGAEALFAELCAKAPTAAVWRARAELAIARQQLRPALGHLQRAAEADPRDEAVLDTGARLADALDDLPAEIGFRRAQVALAPDSARHNTQLAEALLRDGQGGPARWCLDAALRVAPDHPYTRWQRMHALPTVIESEAQRAELVAAWWRDIAQLEQLLAGRRLAPEQALSLLGSTTNFALHYLGEPLLELQRRYAALVEALAGQLFPDLDAPPPRARGARIRIGFASSHFHQHTVLKLFRHWIYGLPRERFETFVFHLDHVRDGWTDRVRASVDHFASDRRLEEWPDLIRGAKLDVLIHLDVGMHPSSQLLAALRLAPLQAVAWGHPVTTGLGAVDAFLSSAAMEAADGERFYRERLVRLPGLSIRYGAPTVEPDPEFRVALPAGRQGYVVCPQTVQKLGPEHDALFAEFCARRPELALVLVPHERAEVRQALARRMAPAFARQGLRLDQHVVMLGGLALPAFLAVARDARLAIDSLDWSGGNSTLETLWQGTPVITCPGATLRSRHSQACVTLAGAPELVVPAAGRARYAEAAATLAADADRLAALRETLVAHRPALFEPAGMDGVIGDWAAAELA